MSKIQAPFIATAAAAVGVAGAAYYSYQYYINVKKSLPEEWTEVGELTNIYAYPIKSCAPVLLNKVECTELGIKDGWLRDRVLMVVNKDNNFISARAYPELFLVHVTIKGSILTLKHTDMEDVQINLAEVVATKPIKTATVWDAEVPVQDCGYEPSEWFSRLLSKSANDFRLVYYASQKSRGFRMKMKNKLYKKLLKSDTGAFPDELAFHLINKASVDDLNTRLKNCQVTPLNFRPNFVIQGAKAYDEDSWQYLKIGEQIFEVIKPCTRCIMTTIDPETGIRNSKTEPLETLKSYRQITDPEERKAAGVSPKMGIQMALRSAPGGQLSVGDTVYIA